jgi:hypothetical protein
MLLGFWGNLLITFSRKIKLKSSAAKAGKAMAERLYSALAVLGYADQAGCFFVS